MRGQDDRHGEEPNIMLSHHRVDMARVIVNGVIHCWFEPGSRAVHSPTHVIDRHAHGLRS